MIRPLHLTGRVLLIGLIVGLAGCNSNPVSEATCEANGGDSYMDDGELICACTDVDGTCCMALAGNANVRGCEQPAAPLAAEPDFASPMAEILASPQTGTARSGA